MEKLRIANKIVDYWRIVEFFNQQLFPKDTRDNAENVKESKEGREHKNIYKLKIFEQIPLKKEIKELIVEGNKVHSNFLILDDKFHLCIGRVKKELLIKELYNCLKIEDIRPEKSSGEICLMALKVDSSGIYIENSLRISPLVWGIAKLIENKGIVNDNISEHNYKKELRSYEAELYEHKIFNKELPLKSKYIEKIFKNINDTYIKPIFKDLYNVKYDGIFSYMRYKDEDFKIKNEDTEDDISELSKGFYTNDLEMIKKSIGMNKSCLNNDDFINYIVSLYESENNINCDKNIQKIDIRNNKEEIEKWLDIRKAPLGKWPSKYDPSLMQQIAINISISDFENRNIFSVNGPPGTGKTTLLKEVIASNIVERAKLLYEYENSDDAFEEHYFQYGSFSNNGYDKYANKYHVFKNKKISQYGMLVASCNNSAVENITKELPDGESLLKGLESDKEITKLSEVSNLFNIKENCSKEYYNIFNKSTNKYEKTPKNDVYFSYLSHKLLNSEKDEINEWGLISAPMGKSKNILNVCRSVLSEFNYNFLNTNLIEARADKYEKARIKFKDQLNKVEGIRKELGKACALKEKYRDEKRRFKKESENINAIIEEHKTNKLREYNLKEDINKNIKIILEEISNIDADKTLLNNKQKNIKSELENAKNEKEAVIEKIKKTEDERKLYEILFGRWIHTERLKQIQEYKDDKEKLVDQIKEIQQKFLNLEQEYINSENRINKYNKDVKDLKNQLSEEDNIIKSIDQMIDIENIRKINIYSELETLKKNLDNELNKMKLQAIVIDDKFWAEFDNSDNADIQASDPWVTSEFDREREKLFYYALKLHKEFILSSKACRDNFKNLSMMWKFEKNSEKEFVVYNSSDKKASYVHLLNTLFLLIPVMSTTFASAGRFLKDIESKESLGTLIIDEAGQASPHVALGALWRCKKAIVVGDPKQVEPVVTDESDAIKKAFANHSIKPYINKTISVQEFADKINNYGSYIKDSDGNKTWVGCPLVIHRRCISPMFDISNEISYGRTMKNKTFNPKDEVKSKFVYDKSGWINVVGSEIGNKNHFVVAQGERALQIIEMSFKKYNGFPKLYVISPFTTVINGLKELVRESTELRKYNKNIVDTWLENNCGTVHKFQGKEAEEVIFLLGCDKKASGAVNWVKPNIVNVAATRAKFRFYIIGDYDVWKQSKTFEITKNIIDNY